MDTIDAIMTRRSIRKYTGKKVSEEQIKTILKAAMAAPSAKNRQPWHFIVVKDEELLSRICEVNPHAEMAKEASLAIIVCADLSLEQSQEFAIEGCSLAGENILLAAHTLGLGAVWTALYPNEARVIGARKLFNIPQNIIPLCLIPIGYPAEEKPSENRFNEERIHSEKW
jgi:nitroreductase